MAETGTEQKQPSKAETGIKKDRSRSFSYPAFSLPEAIAKARTLWQRENANWVAVPIASEHWGFSRKSSSGIRAVAALAHYGLIEETGSKEGRRIRLNQRAKTILLAPPDREAEKQEAIRKAALSPKSYQALWVKHSGKLPSDHGLRYELQTEGGLNDLVIREFIKDFKATVQFAKLTESATLSEDSGADESGEEGREDDQRDPPDEPSRRQKADRMPDTQRGRAMDFPIPLLGGGVATLRLPVPLSRAEYAHFKTFLASMLSGMEPAVTREPQPEVSAGGATDDPNGR